MGVGWTSHDSSHVRASSHCLRSLLDGPTHHFPNPTPPHPPAHPARPSFPLGTSLALLAWGLAEFRPAYEASGQASAAANTLRWGADYLLACWDAPAQRLTGQIGDPGVDHSYWGRADQETGPRPSFVWDTSRPASDLAAAAASALAATSLALRPSDATYADRCLAAARQLLAFAQAREGKYSAAYPSATYVYASSSYLDDLAFAAAWLWRATGEAAYLAGARSALQRAQYQRNYFLSWDSVYAAADALLLAGGAGPSPGVDSAWQLSQFLATWQHGQNGVHFSADGLAIAPLGGWGTLRYSANAALLMLLHASRTNDSAVAAGCVAWARKQVGQGWATGQGRIKESRPLLSSCMDTLPPPPQTKGGLYAGQQRTQLRGGVGQQPAHALPPPRRLLPPPPGAMQLRGRVQQPWAQPQRERGLSDCRSWCQHRPLDLGPFNHPKKQVLYGALVGGPADGDSYTDARSNFQCNEPAMDYNAGFAGALAGLLHLLPGTASGAGSSGASGM